MPGKTARHNAAGPDGGRQVRCIVGPVGDFFFRDTSYAHLLWLAHTQRECCPCPCQICVCVCVPVPAFDQTFIIGPSSSFDTNSARCRHANQPLYFCAVSHFCVEMATACRCLTRLCRMHQLLDPRMHPHLVSSLG